MTLARLFVTGMLAEEDEEAFEIHLLTCRACRADVAAAERSAKEERLSGLFSRLAELEREEARVAEPSRGGAVLADVLTELCAGAEPLLFHVLVCEACRSRATAGLLARHGVGLVLPAGGLGELLGVPCSEPRRELAAEGLLEELLQRPAEHHFDLLDEPRFQDAALVELLLARSQELQVRDPERSEHLAFLASRLACLSLDEAGQARATTRAGTLIANARRLAGLPQEAERAVARATPFSVPRVDRAQLYLVLGLVYWELGRSGEAGGSLREAARLFSELRLAAQEGEALVLLGLLEWEEGCVPQCLASLLAGLPLAAAEQRPWLAARGCLAAAAAFAETGCADEAWGLLRRGREHTAAVEDPEEAAYLYFLEGTVLGRLGEGEQAVELLGPARLRYLSEGRLPEAALASLELAGVLADLDRAEEIGRLAGEVEVHFPKAEGAIEAVTALRSTPWTEPLGLRRAVDSEVMALRRLFRMDGLPFRPVPFA